MIYNTVIYYVQYCIPIHLHVIETILELDLVLYCLLWQSHLDNLVKNPFIFILENEQLANKLGWVVLEHVYVICINSIDRRTERSFQTVTFFFQSWLIECNLAGSEGGIALQLGNGMIGGHYGTIGVHTVIPMFSCQFGAGCSWVTCSYSTLWYTSKGCAQQTWSSYSWKYLYISIR